MPSTYSPSLRLELIASGEQANQWGNTTNKNLGTLLEQSISGVMDVDVTAGDATLTALDGLSDESRNMVLVVTGTPGVARVLYAPEVTKLYVVYNNSDSDVSIATTAVGSVDVAIVPGGSKVVFTDAVDFFEASADLGTPVSGDLSNCVGLPAASVTGVLPVVHGGTGQSAYTNGQLLIGNTSTGGLSKATLIAGPSMVITNGPGTIQLDTSGMVTSVNVSGGTTGLTTSGGPITSSGTITIAGTLGAANGGTGLTSPGTAGNCLQSTGSGWQSAFVPAGFANMVALTSSTTWTIPAGVYSIKVTVIGGGGGGGAHNGTAYTSGNSGGTSSAASGTQTITTISATGGSGGSGGSAYSGVGGAGSGGTLNISGSSGTASTTYALGGASFFAGMAAYLAAGNVYGGGAGGGYGRIGSTSGPEVYGPSGGGGGCAIKYYTSLTPGNTLTITVGSGGAGGASNIYPSPSWNGAAGVVVIEY